MQSEMENFEWPKEADIAAMPLDQPVKLASISYRCCSHLNGEYIKEI